MAEIDEKAVPRDIEAKDIESSKSHDEIDTSTRPYTGKGTIEDRKLVLKQDIRIIPLCAFIYLLCYLDRRYA